MTRQEQIATNKRVEEVYEDAMHEYNNLAWAGRKWKKLRHCSAEVCETENYYILRSYNTIVAVVDKYNFNVYDILRKVYGYTATSAQHIAKFAYDYGNLVMYRWREVLNDVEG